LLESFQLKTCALMAAKQYTVNLNKFFEIKRIDTKYWNFFSDVQVYKHNIKRTKDFDRYVILLNKLEHSEEVSAHYKEVISRMFKWTFV
jgi:protein associated with RNAse G/E